MSAGEETKSVAPPKPTVEDAPQEAEDREVTRRDSQTASEWVNSQLKLEAEAREALPYSFDNCTRPLGSLRQNVFACLTCHPPPATDDGSYSPAGMCYGCSISCHGEHTLVEIFARRNFTCDCGTTRFPDSTPCTLRMNAVTERKGDVKSEEPDARNEYNHNFRNRFCGCNDWYVAEQQRGTMYQCLGLASESEGGCGEDWWHPECLLGLPRDWYKSMQVKQEATSGDKTTEGGDDDEHPIPPGFPDEDDFSTLICYKCVEKTPWLKDYADSKSFMTLTYKKHEQYQDNCTPTVSSKIEATPGAAATGSESQSSTKRKAEETDLADEASMKRARTEEAPEVVSQAAATEDIPPLPTISSASDPAGKATSDKPDSTDTTTSSLPKHAHLPPAPSGTYSLLTTSEDWREHLCRCAACYPRLARLPQLLEEEETYQPPLSSDGGSGENDDGRSAGTASLLDRGEAALSGMDRVRAIEGVMAYNHLRDKVKAFLAPFAESGQAVGAKDVEEYFAKLRGDQEAIREAGRKAREEGASGDGGDQDGDGNGGAQRREQSGY